MFARAADHQECQLVHRKGDCQDLYTLLIRFWKQIDVQMGPHVLSGSDSIAVLSFFAKLRDPCNLKRDPESNVVW